MSRDRHSDECMSQTPRTYLQADHELVELKNHNVHGEQNLSSAYGLCDFGKLNDFSELPSFSSEKWN